MTEFSIATFNTLHGTAEIHPLADVIGWQEADTADVRKRIGGLQFHETYVPKSDALAAIPISWRTKVFELVDAGERMTHSGKAGVSPTRGFVWVRLRHLATGVLVLVINTHMVSGAWTPGHGDKAWRQARWSEHMQLLEAFTRSQSGQMVVVGDMNRLEWIRLPGFHHASTGSAKAPFDQMFSTLHISAARKGPKYGSDHYSWTAAVTLPTPTKETPVSKAQIYPGADAKAQWHADDHPGRTFDANCGCFHTTEGTDWPGYSGGASAPNITFKPDMKAKRLLARQHFPIDMSSRALKNLTGGVETNTLNVAQVELVGTCDPKHRKSWNGQGKLLAGRDYIYWPDAPDWALRELARFMRWCRGVHGIPIDGPKKWAGYPDSYGFKAAQRFTAEQWRAFKGWCGHQHVPENDHGDPGNFPFARLLELVAELDGVDAPVEAPLSQNGHLVNADRALQRALKDESLKKVWPQLREQLGELRDVRRSVK